MKNLDKQFDEKFGYKDALTDGTKIKQFYNQKIKEMVDEMIGEENPHKSQLCQNRNGLEYCGTCEQAWDNCSCSARNTGYNKKRQEIINISKKYI